MNLAYPELVKDCISVKVQYILTVPLRGGKFEGEKITHWYVAINGGVPLL